MTFRQSSFEQEGMEATGSFSGTFSGSFEGSVANAVSASFAETASFALAGGSGGAGTTTGSFTGSFTGALLGTASFAETSSVALTSISASHAITASFALAGAGGAGGTLTVTTYSFYDGDFKPDIAIDGHNDEFESSSLASIWTIQNQGDTTYSLADGILTITDPTADFIVHRIEQIPSGSNWVMRAKVSFRGEFIAQGYIGIFVQNSANSNLEIFGLGRNASNVSSMTLFTFSSPTVFNSTVKQEAIGDHDLTSWIYLEIEYDGANLIYRQSANGISWEDYSTRTTASFLAAAPNRIGIWEFSDTSNNEFTGSADWFRFTTGTRGEDLNGGQRSVVTNVTLT